LGLAGSQEGNALYATLLAWPESGAVAIKSLAEGSGLLPEAVAAVELLGVGAVEWSRDAHGLHVKLPAQRPCEHAYSLRVSLEVWPESPLPRGLTALRA
jgi:alpha-L-fucosidase